MILTGCAGSAGLQHAAGERLGAVAAGVELERQPRECREDWPLLDREDLVGREAIVGIDLYEAYIADTINPSKRRCWRFNENQRVGLKGGKQER